MYFWDPSLHGVAEDEGVVTETVRRKVGMVNDGVPAQGRVAEVHSTAPEESLFKRYAVELVTLF